jgi:crotonobetainyl-CoA hydratase
MTSVITTRSEDGVFEVTLDRPKANAIDLKTSRLLGETFQVFRDDPELRVAIVKTAGDKFFSAGWDLKAAAGGDAVDGDYGVGGFGGLQELRDMNKPVIACVNGMAVGGGFELALSCDLIYASDHSSFALPEIRAGTLADAATVKLPKRIPYHVAMDLLLTGGWMWRRRIAGGWSTRFCPRRSSRTGSGRSHGCLPAGRRWSLPRSRRWRGAPRRWNSRTR